MKNTIDLPSSILRIRGILMRFEPVKMSLSELQRRNLIVKFCLAKVRLLSTLNYWDLGLPLFIVQLKGLRSKKKWREKLVLGKNVNSYRLKFVLP
jgi:hypothetical protein